MHSLLWPIKFLLSIFSAICHSSKMPTLVPIGIPRWRFIYCARLMQIRKIQQILKFWAERNKLRKFSKLCNTEGLNNLLYVFVF